MDNSKIKILARRLVDQRRRGITFEEAKSAGMDPIVFDGQWGIGADAYFGLGTEVETEEMILAQEEAALDEVGMRYPDTGSDVVNVTGEEPQRSIEQALSHIPKLPGKPREARIARINEGMLYPPPRRSVEG